MTNKKYKKTKSNKYKLNVKENKGIEGSFPLNPNRTDRISFSAEVDKNNNVQKISNVSYEMLIENTWEWIVRYDDHGGDGELHRHERISLKDESEAKLPYTDGVKRAGSKRKLFHWAIKDIKKNYLVYRKKFSKRNGLDLY